MAYSWVITGTALSQVGACLITDICRSGDKNPGQKSDRGHMEAPTSMRFGDSAS